MATHEEMVEERINSFLEKSRSENTRKIARLIVEFLLDKRQESWESLGSSNKWDFGWTRAGLVFERFKDEHPRTITRMLQNLSEEGIILRKECSRIKGHPGKAPVFYRVPDFYQPRLFFTREELIAELQACDENREMLASRYSELILLYQEKTGEKPNQIIKERVKKRKAASDAHTEEISKRGIQEIDPCESL